jgi:hypothetical protein
MSRIKDPVTCPWCGQWTHLQMVRSHLECPVCRRVIYDCCDGEQADEKASDTGDDSTSS